eukprot:RCo012242
MGSAMCRNGGSDGPKKGTPALLPRSPVTGTDPTESLGLGPKPPAPREHRPEASACGPDPPVNPPKASLKDAPTAEVVECLSMLIDPSEALIDARLCYPSGPGERGDPRFPASAIRRLQARTGALLGLQLCPEVGITQRELDRARLALKVFRLPSEQFAALFLYSEEIEETEAHRKPDQLYTLLTTAQRAAAHASTDPSHPAH